MGYFISLWDQTDDWSLWDAPSQVSRSHVASPSGQRYRGGYGRLTDAWTGSSTDFDWKTNPFQAVLGTGRVMRLSFAMRFAEVSFLGTREGPFLIECLDQSNSSLGVPLSVETLLDGTVQIPSAQGGSGTFNIKTTSNRWLVFQFTGESRGAAAPFSVSARLQVWGDYSNRLKPLAQLVWSAPSTAIKTFAQFRFGWNGLNQTSPDTFEVHVDEYRAFTDASVYPADSLVLPRLRRSAWSTTPL